MPKNKTKTPKQEEPSKAWSIDTSAIKPKHTEGLTDSEKQNCHKFANEVAKGVHPATAGKDGDYDYKKFGNTANQYQIRLSGDKRATFLVDKQDKKVNVLGFGHTKTKK